MNITKYKKLNMTEHKTDMSITKIDKYIKNWTAIQWRSTRHMNTTKYKKQNMTEHKTGMNTTEKLSSTSTAECKTNMNITEKLSSTFTIEH